MKNRPQQHLKRIYMEDTGSQYKSYKGKTAGPRIYHVKEVEAGISRRRFLLGGAVSLGALTACGSSGGGGNKPTGTGKITYLDRSLAYGTGPIVDVHPMAMASMVFNPKDGKLLTGAANSQRLEDNTVVPTKDNLKIWDIPSGELLDTPQTETTAAGGGNYFNVIEFIDGGNTLVNFDGGELVYRSYPQLQIIRTSTIIYTASGLPTGFDINSDGTILAICTESTAMVFDVSAEQAVETNRFSAQTGEFFLGLRFSPDSAVLAVGTGNGNFKFVRRWQLADDSPLPVLSPPSSRFFSEVAFSPDGRYVVGLSKQGVYIWDTNDNSLVKRIDDKFPYYSEVKITPDGGAFSFASASGDTRSVEIWNFSDFTLRKSIDIVVPDSEIFGSDSHSPMTHCYSADGKYLAMGFSGGGGVVWELPQGSYVTTLFDPTAFRDGFSAKYFTLLDEQNREINYVNACSDKIPDNAVCTCDCVPGEFVPPPIDFQGGRQCGFVCSCNLVCSCNYI